MFTVDIEIANSYLRRSDAAFAAGRASAAGGRAIRDEIREIEIVKSRRMFEGAQPDAAISEYDAARLDKLRRDLAEAERQDAASDIELGYARRLGGRVRDHLDAVKLLESRR